MPSREPALTRPSIGQAGGMIGFVCSREGLDSKIGPEAPITDQKRYYCSLPAGEPIGG